MRTFSRRHTEILRKVQGDLPDSATPYADIAAEVSAMLPEGEPEVTEAEVLELLQGLKGEGVIRRFGATLRHQHAGYRANAMVAWIVDPSDMDRVGKAMAGHPHVSHCYYRPPQGDWPYALYTMVHAQSREGCLDTVQELSRLSGLTEHAVLYSVKELKKTSMTYF